MTKVRDDRRRDSRRHFATFHANGDRVGVDVLEEADDCWTEYGWDISSEWRRVFAQSQSEAHVPGSHVLKDVFAIRGASA